MDPPKLMRAVVCTGQGGVEMREIKRPSCGPEDVLVSVSSVALNPTDWKSAKQAAQGKINGCDFCGTVVEVGRDARGIVNVGERVCGMQFGSRSSERGAFCEWTVHAAQQVWTVPESVSDDEAASFGGIAIDTVAQAFYIGTPGQENRLLLPWPTEGQSDKTILIWSGASSTGSLAIQMAKITGLTVVTTASKKNWDALRALGADHLYDYGEEGIEQQIAERHNVELGLDCYAMGESTKRMSQAFGRQGGKIVTLLPVERKGAGWRDDVSSAFTLVYTNLGEAFKFGSLDFPASPEDAKGAAKWHTILPKLLTDGKLRPNRLRRCPGLLEKVHEGLVHMEQGKHSHEKLVYRITDEFQPVPPAL